ncbi:MAG: hypothetical protein SO253_04040 [Bacilli bacterium]|nr:hypothetical protein [Bacilli bacterium]
MKKFIILFILLFLTSCAPRRNEIKEIPIKINPNGLDVSDSSITTLNLDDYLLRDDVFYCDLRYYSWVLKDGYIPGFTFVPYYNFISARSGINAFFRQEKKEGINEGDIGSYRPLYQESIYVLNSLFPKDKKIFLISQSGLESYYMGALLTQFGYDSSKIYNVGGVSVSTNFPAYVKVGNNFVKGNNTIPSDVNGSLFEVDFTKLDITLIEE